MKRKLASELMGNREPETEGIQGKFKKKPEEYNKKANIYLIRVSEEKIELKTDTLLSGFYAA